MKRRPSVSVETPKYANVDVDHPRVVEAVKVLTIREKKSVEQISKIVGMPFEVVEKHMRTAREGK